MAEESFDVGAGTAVPTMSLWRRAWEGWKRFAHALGVFQTRLIMTILYFVLVLPVGLIVRLVSDPLHLRKREGSNWLPVSPQTHSLDSARQQF